MEGLSQDRLHGQAVLSTQARGLRWAWAPAQFCTFWGGGRDVTPGPTRGSQRPHCSDQPWVGGWWSDQGTLAVSPGRILGDSALFFSRNTSYKQTAKPSHTEENMPLKSMANVTPWKWVPVHTCYLDCSVDTKGGEGRYDPSSSWFSFPEAERHWWTLLTSFWVFAHFVPGESDAIHLGLKLTSNSIAGHHGWTSWLFTLGRNTWAQGAEILCV